METAETKLKATFYIAVMIYESSSQAQEYETLYEESFVLIKAASEEEAQAKAKIHGNTQALSFRNANHVAITWTLKQVLDVAPVLDENFEDGSDLYARHFRNYEAYRAFEPLLSDTLPD